MGDFSSTVVNQRFSLVYTALENNNLIRGKSDLAQKLGTYNHVINSILKGQRNVTVEQLNKLFDYYEVNANFVFGQSDTIFLKRTGTGSIPTRGMEEQSSQGRKNIVLVPDRATAGYALAHQDASYLENLPRFSIPGIEGGALVAFEISGDSMMPTITNGDLVVCEKIERGEPLRDNQVYVIVSDVVVAKRIQQIKSKDQLRLLSDNATVYQSYTIDFEDIRQILKVKCRLTTHAIS
ncbi:MAG: helix-turn-helix transcriptional regulator [Saprospiraceae bacterium]